MIGLLPEEGTWVTEGLNITKDEIQTNPKIISYDRGKTAFYRGIIYAQLNDADYQTLYLAAKTSVYKIRTKVRGFVPDRPVH